MYQATVFVLLGMSMVARIEACSINCGDQCMCVAPGGLGADCSGFKGCHEKCPSGLRGIGCKANIGNSNP